jgi:hypothetical protein
MGEAAVKNAEALRNLHYRQTAAAVADVGALMAAAESESNFPTSAPYEREHL